MADQKVYRAIGLMSGTSLDGVDIALIETDGHADIRPLRSAFYPYDNALRDYVRRFFGQPRADQHAIDLITNAHISALRDFNEHADIIGFHGQTLYHAPDQGITVQIGDAPALARALSTPVAYDFRSHDVACGGQGAPLLPLYHRARLLQSQAALPAAIINIGGVSNITWIGGSGDNDILAFDCGPGGALMDDYTQAHFGQPFDTDGAYAAQGQADEALLQDWLAQPFFAKQPPKSLDRDAWNLQALSALKDPKDALATLSAFTARAIHHGLSQCPSPPKALYICGGGRHNAHLMAQLAALTGASVHRAETLGWDGDALEAEGFAFLAVRHLLDLPLSLPRTTGVSHPCTGGKLCRSSV